MALFHNLFTHKTTTGTGEPFLDALVKFIQ